MLQATLTIRLSSNTFDKDELRFILSEMLTEAKEIAEEFSDIHVSGEILVFDNNEN